MTDFCSNNMDELDEEPYDDAKSGRTSDENRKQNHSEIEKRRRDKMNTYINELSSMIPMAMHRKLDKLTVLRMAVQHLRAIRGSLHPYSGCGDMRPPFLSDQELKMLILQAAEGFLFVVGCDRGSIKYVSESVTQILNCTQADLLGQSWFDVLHPKDVAKVKDQLSSLDSTPRERLIDAKTMLPVKTDIQNQGMWQLCPGARRSFFCRMKLKACNAQIKEESDTSSSSRSSTRRSKSKLNSDHKYRVIQCTGYLKAWSSFNDLNADGDDCDGSGSATDGSQLNNNPTCLVAVGRIPPNMLKNKMSLTLDSSPEMNNVQFMSRHSLDGKFLYIDQTATLLIGYLNQEILGTSFYEYFHHDDMHTLGEAHKLAVQSSQKVTTHVYRFRCKDNTYASVQSEWRTFKNPWTTDIDYIMAKNTVLI